MTKTVTLHSLRYSSNSFHSSALPRQLWLTRRSVLVGRYFRAPRFSASFKLLINNTFLAYLLFFIQFSRYLVGLSGLEPPTSRLSGGRSNRLSYKPISCGTEFPLLLCESFKPLVEIIGIEPMTPCLQSRCSPS